MSYERMQQAEADLEAQIDALLERAKSTDAAEAEEPELDIPAEIGRREVRLKAIAEARERLEQRQREADIERAVAQTAFASPATRTATRRADATSASSACPRRRHKTTSPTPTAAS